MERNEFAYTAYFASVVYRKPESRNVLTFCLDFDHTEEHYAVLFKCEL